MHWYPTYTVYLRGFERIGAESGLSLTNAFRRALSLAHQSYEFEERPDGGALVFSRRGLANGATSDALQSLKSIESDAKHELMIRATDGRLHGFTICPDEAFLNVRSKPAMRQGELDSSIVHFLLRALLEEHAHRFPMVTVPQRGHALNGFRLGLDGFAGELTRAILGLGITWSKTSCESTSTEAPSAPS